MTWGRPKIDPGGGKISLTFFAGDGPAEEERYGTRFSIESDASKHARFRYVLRFTILEHESHNRLVSKSLQLGAS